MPLERSKPSPIVEHADADAVSRLLRKPPCSWSARLAREHDHIGNLIAFGRQVRLAGHAIEGDRARVDDGDVSEAMERAHGDGGYAKRRADLELIFRALPPAVQPNVLAILLCMKRAHIEAAERAFDLDRADAARHFHENLAAAERPLQVLDPIGAATHVSAAAEPAIEVSAGDRPLKAGRPSKAWLTIGVAALSALHLPCDVIRILLKGIGVTDPRLPSRRRKRRRE